MNKEDRNSFRKEMLGKIEERWAKSNSPEDDLFYYHPSERNFYLLYSLFLIFIIIICSMGQHENATYIWSIDKSFYIHKEAGSMPEPKSSLIK